jgi:hypothetical protein
MRKRAIGAMLVAILALSIWPMTARAGGRLGGGVHYLHNLGDIKEESGLDENAFSILGSYQLSGGLLSFEADLEYVFDLFGTGEAAWMPQAYVLAGGLIYGGLGIGISYFDGDWSSDPFYNLRAGVDLPLGGMDLDMYATYQFWSDEDLKGLTGDDLNSVTFAAVLRFGL